MIICIHQAQAQRCQMGKPKAPNAFTNLGLSSESNPLKPKSTLILPLGLSAWSISIILDWPRTPTPSHAWIGLQLKPKYSSSPQLLSTSGDGDGGTGDEKPRRSPRSWFKLSALRVAASIIATRAAFVVAFQRRRS